MKLLLKARVASRYNDPVLDYFAQQGFCIEHFSPEDQGSDFEGWGIYDKPGYISNLYYSENQLELNNACLGGPEGLLGSNLCEEVYRLCEEINQGDLGKNSPS